MNKWIYSLMLVSAFVFGQQKEDSKWIVVTTIQYPTEQLKKMSSIPGWRLVVVGDKKTPKDWHLENCEYLSPERQSELGYELASLLPWNHYCRKNLGYLFAIEHGAKIIYETDDDNEVITDLNFCQPTSKLHSLTSIDDSINIYDYFGEPGIWPRGFPLENICHQNPLQLNQPETCIIGIEQGIVNGAPDVDAIFRLTQDRKIDFMSKAPVSLPEKKFCAFNSQNTFFHPVAFFTMYIPHTVSMRVSDIWRGYFAQKLIWDLGARLVFSGPSAVQERNEHSLINDFFLEQQMYLQVSRLVKYLKEWQSLSSNPSENMRFLYTNLIQEAYLEKDELVLLNAWLRDLEKVSSK